LLTDSIPIAKSRVNKLHYASKQIKDKYSRKLYEVREGLENMFNIIKEYKGRDDFDNIVEEFVKKYKQIQKLG
jgi:hypothetical protein